ncbi:protein LURP-one-related 14-like [Herrania umbratica]|uniref:Protein LURP-one-related 14-like n=1 Tax=Herrania umbratica TaxID=108875 RepID=A0A6J1B9U0_9ROSI|nr:protein LURP-one-related 14-like [Herrania umbratica]
MTASQMVYGVPMISFAGDGFCVPYSVEFILEKKQHGFSDVHYEVSDVNKKVFLQSDGSYMTLYRKRVMRNSTGFPILTIREKVNHNSTRGSFCQGRKENFGVKVHSGVDYAFILALIITLLE